MRTACCTYRSITSALHSPVSLSLSLAFFHTFSSSHLPNFLLFRIPSGAASLRGVGSCRYGFRLVDRAYSSERPEAAFRIPPSIPPPLWCSLPFLFRIPNSSSHSSITLCAMPYALSDSTFDVGRSMFIFSVPSAIHNPQLRASVLLFLHLLIFPTFFFPAFHPRPMD